MVGNIETRVGLFVLIGLGIFMYMGFKIGAFRLDRGNYACYTLFFKDISGLSRKGDVKIAGVKVGWVEAISLIPEDHGMQAEVNVMVVKDYALYSDAYAMVKQDGLLGPKFIEIAPGDPLLRKLQSGEQLSRPSTEVVSVDELMHQFKKIASNVDEITGSFKDVVGGPEGREKLENIVEDIRVTVERLASVSDMVDRSFARNEEHVDNFMQIGTSFRNSLDKISDVFDRDFNRVASRLEVTAMSVEDASNEARDGLRNVSSVAQKIDEGKGLLGKLVNEDETYHDLKLAIEGFKNYLTQVDRMQIIFDSYSETMIRRAEGYKWEDTKGFFNIRIHPREDYFYQLQIVSSQKGWTHREFIEVDYFDSEGKEIDTEPLQDRPLPERAPVDNTEALDTLTRLGFVFDQQKVITKRDAFRMGLQFGKIFGDIALRFGLFEGTAGAGVDVEVPFRTPNFRWVTTFEAYDWSGRTRRIEDRRPHFTWLNRMFIMRNLYTTFGADDFVSQKNASIFFGIGLRFGDDDVKYLLSNISGIGSTTFLQS